MPRNLIRCGDHCYAPASIVCRHLVDGTSHAWFRLPAQDGEEADDWLCEDCFAKGPWDISVDDLRSICVRELRRRSKVKKKRRN